MLNNLEQIRKEYPTSIPPSFRVFSNFSKPGTGDLAVLTDDNGKFLMVKTIQLATLPLNQQNTFLFSVFPSQMPNVQQFIGFDSAVPANQIFRPVFSFSPDMLSTLQLTHRVNKKPLPEEVIWKVYSDLSQAKSSLQQKGLYHPFISLDNVFYHQGRFTLTSPFLYNTFIQEQLNLRGLPKTSADEFVQKRGLDNSTQLGYALLQLTSLASDQEIRTDDRYIKDNLRNCLKISHSSYSAELNQVIESLIKARMADPSPTRIQPGNQSDDQQNTGFWGNLIGTLTGKKANQSRPQSPKKFFPDPAPAQVPPTPPLPLVTAAPIPIVTSRESIPVTPQLPPQVPSQNPQRPMSPTRIGSLTMAMESPGLRDTIPLDTQGFDSHNDSYIANQKRTSPKRRIADATFISDSDSNSFLNRDLIDPRPGLPRVNDGFRNDITLPRPAQITYSPIEYSSAPEQYTKEKSFGPTTIQSSFIDGPPLPTYTAPSNNFLENSLVYPSPIPNLGPAAQGNTRVAPMKNSANIPVYPPQNQTYQPAPVSNTRPVQQYLDPPQLISPVQRGPGENGVSDIIMRQTDPRSPSPELRRLLFNVAQDVYNTETAPNPVMPLPRSPSPVRPTMNQVSSATLAKQILTAVGPEIERSRNEQRIYRPSPREEYLRPETLPEPIQVDPEPTTFPQIYNTFVQPQFARVPSPAPRRDRERNPSGFRTSVEMVNPRCFQNLLNFSPTGHSRNLNYTLPAPSYQQDRVQSAPSPSLSDSIVLPYNAQPAQQVASPQMMQTQARRSSPLNYAFRQSPPSTF